MGDIRVEVSPAGGGYGQDLAGPPVPELLRDRAGEMPDGVAEVARQFQDRIDDVTTTETATGWKLGQARWNSDFWSRPVSGF